MKQRTVETICYLLVLLFQIPLAGPAAAAAPRNTPLEKSVTAAEQTGVPSSLTSRVLILANDQRINPEHTRGFISTLSRAKKQGFSLEPFMNKIEEGISKHVPADRILSVLEQKMAHYARIQAMIPPFPHLADSLENNLPAADLGKLAESICCGITDHEVRQVFARARDNASVIELCRTFGVMAVLKQISFEPDLAHQIIIHGIDHGYFAKDQVRLSRALVTARQKQIPDQRVARVVIEQMAAGKAADTMMKALGIGKSATPDGTSAGPGKKENRSGPSSGSGSGSGSGGNGSGAGGNSGGPGGDSDGSGGGDGGAGGNGGGSGGNRGNSN